MSCTLDIVVPVFNEEETIAPLVDRLRQVCPDARLIFVDNGSTDRTLEILAADSGLRLIRHERNLGYGRSIRDGIDASDGDLIVIIDADLEYYPEDIPVIVSRLASVPAVYGSRLLSPGNEATMPCVRSAGNRLVTVLFNLFFGQKLTDLYTGLRAFRRTVLPREGIESDGFEFVLEISARLARAGIRITEVPVRYRPRTTGRSKMRHISEFVKFVYHLLRLRLAAAPPVG